MARPSEIVYYSNHSFSAEIVDLFLDDCEQDSATLISSSLVSKKWALSTRRHLFSSLGSRVVQIFGINCNTC